MIGDWAMTAALTAFNRALRADPETLRRLGRLQGRAIALDITGAGCRGVLLPGPHGFDWHPDYPEPPDAAISGPPFSLARLMLRRGDDASQPPPGVTLTGDLDVIRRLHGILTAMDFDWEEALSRITGDAAAHQAGRRLRGLAHWGRQATESLARDAAEYCQEEARWLPAAGEVAAFLDAVDDLRADTDRLDARLRRLTHCLAERTQNE